MNVPEITREKLRHKPSAVLLDADNTLFAYEFPHAQASAAVEKCVLADFGIPPAEFRSALKKGRAAIKERLGPVASSHSRLLYFQNTHKGRLPSHRLHFFAQRHVSVPGPQVNHGEHR